MDEVYDAAVEGRYLVPDDEVREIIENLTVCFYEEYDASEGEEVQSMGMYFDDLSFIWGSYLNEQSTRCTYHFVNKSLPTGKSQPPMQERYFLFIPENLYMELYREVAECNPISNLIEYRSDKDKRIFSAICKIEPKTLNGLRVFRLFDFLVHSNMKLE